MKGEVGNAQSVGEYFNLENTKLANQFCLFVTQYTNA